MIIMGIDPGTARIGWGVIELNGAVIRPKACGLITTDKEDSPQDRLNVLFDEINGVFDTYGPDEIGMEELFFSTNAKTAMAVGAARGVLLLAAARKRIPVASYAPNTVKRTITGDGKADKKQVTAMVVRTLKLKEAPKPDDVADALAIGLTHAFSYKLGRNI